MSKFKFKFDDLGRIVSSRSVHERIIRDVDFHNFVNSSLTRYMCCDWGDCEEEDAALNDFSVENGEGRVFAVYKQPRTDTKIWIITETDRSVTTVLSPSDY